MTVIMPDANMLNNPYFLLIILLILLLQLRQRRVRLISLMIMPALLSFITIPMVAAELTTIFNGLVILISLLIGLGIGILIGRFFEVKIDEKGAMVLKGSFIAVFIWIIVILIKMYGENILSGTGWIELNLLTSALLCMTLGAMISRRIYVYLKFLKFKKSKMSSKA